MGGNTVKWRLIPVLLIACFAQTGSAQGETETAKDATLKATLVNEWPSPVMFEFYKRGEFKDTKRRRRLIDERKRRGFFTQFVAACSTIDVTMDIDKHLPEAVIRQAIYRSVGAKEEKEISVCVNVKGEYEGLVEGGAEACKTARKSKDYATAVEITFAQGDMTVLGYDHPADTKSCNQKKRHGRGKKCVSWSATWNFTPSVGECHGN